MQAQPPRTSWLLLFEQRARGETAMDEPVIPSTTATKLQRMILESRWSGSTGQEVFAKITGPDKVLIERRV